MPLLIPPCNAHDKLIRAMVKTQTDHPFFSYILMNFNVSAKEDKWIPTAGVNKAGDFFYNEKFIDSLSSAECIGLLVHETLHIAKGDFFRQGNRDHQIWGIASDMIINYILKQEKFTLPSNGYIPNTHGNLTIAGTTYNVNNKCTEQLYEELYKNANKIKASIPNGDDFKRKGDDSKENVNTHGSFDVHIEGNESSQTNSALENKWKKITIEAATASRTRGDLPGCMVSTIDKLLNPTIDWRTRIMKFITSEIPVDYCNRIPGRKFYATGVWFPRIRRENLEVFISVDVSGSTLADRAFFISEVAGILSSYEQIRARLIFWDAVVHEENDFEITNENKHDLVSLKIKDCDGGTILSSYQEYLEKKNYKCRLHVILTDGYLESSPKIPDGNVIFVLSADGSDAIVKNYGAVCRISDIDN